MTTRAEWQAAYQQHLARWRTTYAAQGYGPEDLEACAELAAGSETVAELGHCPPEDGDGTTQGR